MASSLIETELLAVADASKKGYITPLSFITGVKCNANYLKMLNNMTFIYNPSWDANVDGTSTLPIAFFYCKKITELSESEVSQKKMLFYNSIKPSDNEVAVSGVLNIVADNIIVKPKVYKMEVLVPYTATNYMEQYQFSTYNLANINEAVFWNPYEKLAKDIESKTKVNDPIYNLLKTFRNATAIEQKIVTTTIETIKTLIDALCTEINIASITSAILNQNDYNKQSIDAMWQSRSILKLKMWNGWKFKYLAIQSLELSKSGEYDNYYEGTITFTELPIMTVGDKNSALTTAKDNSSIMKLASVKKKTATQKFMDSADLKSVNR